MRRGLVAVALAAAVGAGGAARSDAPAEQGGGPRIDRLHWAAPRDLVAELGLLVVRNPHGDVRARRAEDGILEVSGMRQPLAPGPDHVGFDIARRGDALVISVAYPPGRRETVQPAQDATDRLDLTVMVPDGLALDAESLRGIVEARRLPGPVRARTLDGDILAWATAPVHAESRAGNIEAHPGGAEGPTILESQAGQVIVVLDPSQGADVWAEAGGKVAAEVEGQVSRVGGISRFHAVRRDGSPLILARSATADVTVRYEK